jgi:hypothetical protein
VGEGLGLDPLVEGVQVGGLAGGDGEDDLRVVGVADDPAADGLDAVVGADFPGQGVGQCGREQDRGPLVGGDGDGDVVGPALVVLVADVCHVTPVDGDGNLL